MNFIAHKIFIESNQTIEPYEAATVQIQLNQGAFADAPVYVYPYIVHQKTIQISIDEAQDFHVTQTIQLTANEKDVSYPLSPEEKHLFFLVISIPPII